MELGHNLSCPPIVDSWPLVMAWAWDGECFFGIPTVSSLNVDELVIQLTHDDQKRNVYLLNSLWRTKQNKTKASGATSAGVCFECAIHHLAVFAEVIFQILCNKFFTLIHTTIGRFATSVSSQWATCVQKSNFLLLATFASCNNRTNVNYKKMAAKVHVSTVQQVHISTQNRYLLVVVSQLKPPTNIFLFKEKYSHLETCTMEGGPSIHSLDWHSEIKPKDQKVLRS